MMIKSIVAKRFRWALNNGWSRMRLNLWGCAERQGKCSHRPPPTLFPSLSPSPERHYSGRFFRPSLDIIQCNHPSIKKPACNKRNNLGQYTEYGEGWPCAGRQRINGPLYQSGLLPGALTGIRPEPELSLLLRFVSSVFVLGEYEEEWWLH